VARPQSRYKTPLGTLAALRRSPFSILGSQFSTLNSSASITSAIRFVQKAPKSQLANLFNYCNAYQVRVPICLGGESCQSMNGELLLREVNQGKTHNKEMNVKNLKNIPKTLFLYKVLKGSPITILPHQLVP